MGHRLRGAVAGWLLPALLLAALPGIAPTRGAEVPGDRERALKAALLYKLTKFVTWPADAFDAPRAPLGICVVGHDPFGGALDAIGGRTVSGRPIRVQRHAGPAAARGCHLAFIPDSEAPRLEAAMDSLAEHPVLLVSDIHRFAEQGGMVEIARDGRRLGFRINLGRARAAGLELAAPLLQLSTLVEGPG